jgi:hypothetical protein
LLLAAASAAHDGGTVLPIDHDAIRYGKRPARDPVAPLAEKLRAGAANLTFDPDHGYLPAVLRELKIPLSSQVLVFSKTSFQAVRIAPRLPRAIYFNDEVTVGWVRGGDVVEFAAADPDLGTVFYSLDQEERQRPSIERRGMECLQCHHAPATQGVPGLMVRSVETDRYGKPMFPEPSYITDHRSPLDQRWGGWYVSGTHGSARHMGNTGVLNKTDLREFFDIGAYLTPHSDIVALMVLEHQTQALNLIARATYQFKMGKTADIGELARYLSFQGEAPLEAPLEGTSGFARQFAQQGPRDPRGRSLRDFDLKGRIFRYPLSFLIYSRAFDGMPPALRERIWRELYDRLRKSSDGRSAIEVVRATKPGVPAYWMR